MKKIITAICCTAMMFGTAMTAHAAETLDRDYIESEIWEDMWHGKGDDGTTFPEASYKHHLLDEWIDDNYGSDEYDWTEIGELKYEYKRYYQDIIEDWDFNDDDNGNWTIETPEHSYSFTYWQDNWIMTDENGNTVDSFPPFSTLKDDEEPEVPQGRHIDDDGNGSPRVIGKVSGGTESASEDVSGADSEVTPDTASNGSESRSGASESNPMPIIAGVAIAAGVGVGGYFMMKKKK